MQPDELRRLFPNASPDVLAANTQSAGAATELERRSPRKPLAADQTQEERPGLLHIRIVSIRKCLCDPDNISEKWMLDALRFGGAIQGDEPDKITLETTQRKASKGEEEHTLIQIFHPSPKQLLND